VVWSLRNASFLLDTVDQDAANAWFKERDPEGVAFAYEMIGEPMRRHVR
jgi:hypothetical protein